MGIENNSSMSRKAQRRRARKLGMPLRLWLKQGESGQTAEHKRKAKADRLHGIRAQRASRKEAKQKAEAERLAKLRQAGLLDLHAPRC